MEAASALGLLRRRWLPLLVCILIGLSAAFVVTRQTPKTYAASTTLIINIPNAGSSAEALQGLQLSTQLLKSYASIATSRSSAEQIRKRLGLSDSADSIRGSLSATPEPETLLISLSATAPQPGRAADIANAAAAVLIDSVRTLESGKSARVDPRVVDAAIPSFSPVRPRPKINMAIGLFVGLISGLAAALLIEALDRAVKTTAQAEAGFGAPLLAVVPRLPSVKGRQLPSIDNPLTPAGEAYRNLRTAVRFISPDHPLRTVLVTSPGPGEGKTTTATNLAVSLAQAGERVVLVDADLRRGRVVDIFGLPGGVGLTSVITHTATLEEALQGSQDRLAVLGTGPLPPNPSELLGSEAMAQILEQLRPIADVVVLDGPPVLAVSDAVALATQVDGVVMVARAGSTDRQDAFEAAQRLERVSAHVVGCVLNGAAKTTTAYYDGYQYLPKPPTKEEAEPRRGRRVAR
ncbi:MAG: capsular biosynthesis protein [Frankiales bacterium]|nr:capsular biosynthesis protein [Frankiales bacterium]